LEDLKGYEDLQELKRQVYMLDDWLGHSDASKDQITWLPKDYLRRVENEGPNFDSKAYRANIISSINRDSRTYLEKTRSNVTNELIESLFGNS